MNSFINTTMDTSIDSAIADLYMQNKPNYAATAKKYQVNRTTLRRRFLGTQLSMAESRSEVHQKLTIIQEGVLIDWINRLTDRTMPPTSQIVRNVAEELSGSPVGKNWVSQFVGRYKDRLHSVYLRSIDRKRIAAENTDFIKMFYNQVCILFSLDFVYIFFTCN
jgi:transposase-like protein